MREIAYESVLETHFHINNPSSTIGTRVVQHNSHPDLLPGFVYLLLSIRRLLALTAWIQNVTQSFSQEIKTKHCDSQRRAGEE